MTPEERLLALENQHERAIAALAFMPSDEIALALKTIAETEEILRRIRAMNPPPREQEPNPSRRITSATPRHEPPNDLPGVGSG